MITTEVPFKSSDNTTLYRLCFKSNNESNLKPKAIFHIVHGMAEHSKRYERLAGELVKCGFIVYADDHRGHGETALRYQNQPLGVAISEKQRRLNALTPEVDPLYNKYLANGFERIILDMKEMVSEEKSLHGEEVPYIMLGHSMGSVIAHIFAGRYGNMLDALVLSGVVARPNILIAGGAPYLLSAIRLSLGYDTTSSIIHTITVGSYPGQLQYTEEEIMKHKDGSLKKSENDWLSRDRDEVDKYDKDHLCGFQCSIGFYVDFLPCLFALKDSATAMKNYPKCLPCLIMYGEKDPCGEFGYATEQILGEFKVAGIPAPSVTKYEGARHEIFNEVNRDEVTNDLIQWCKEVVLTGSKL